MLQPLSFLSVCSGLEAASVAWNPLGWRAHAVSEIEPFPCHVLSHRHGATAPMFMPDPDAEGLGFKERRRRAAMAKAMRSILEGGTIPNFGDMTAFKEWPDATADLLVGGTPCQSFSVAGLRKGLDDPRGNLALTYLAIAERYRPEWLVWENVPGVLSSNGGRDLGAFLGGMAKLGYGFAYRVLDAQYVRTCGLPWAVPQRRRRVFVVGYLGDWRPAAAALFDRQSMRGDPAPRRRAGQGVAGTLDAGLGVRGQPEGERGHLIPSVANPLTARMHKGVNTTMDEGQTMIPQPVAHALRADGFDASEDGTGRGTPLIPVAFDTTQITSASNYSRPKPDDPCHPLAAGAHPPAIAYGINARQDPDFWEGRTGPLDTYSSSQAVIERRATRWAVRRLSVRECERLQGFPDDFTDVPYRGKNSTAEGPRYKALGNSMAVNAMEWIGQRIQHVREVMAEVDQ